MNKCIIINHSIAAALYISSISENKFTASYFKFWCLRDEICMIDAGSSFDER